MELSPASSEWRCIEVLEVWYKTSTVKAQEAASTATSSRHCETPLSRSCRCRYASGNGNVSIVSFCCCWRTFTAMLCCVSRNADDMQAKATERSRSTGGEKGRLFFCRHLGLRAQFRAACFVRVCAALSSLACCCLPWLSLPAPARRYASHRKSLYRRHVCVRGYQPGLTPAKHCEGKRFLNFRRKRSADRLPKPSRFFFISPIKDVSFTVLDFFRNVCLSL